MKAWEPLCIAGDIKEFWISTDWFESRGEKYRFLCVQVLRDGRQLPARYRDMERIAEFLNEFGADEIVYDDREDAEVLKAELETARRRLRGEIH